MKVVFFIKLPRFMFYFIRELVFLLICQSIVFMVANFSLFKFHLGLLIILPLSLIVYETILSLELQHHTLTINITGFVHLFFSPCFFQPALIFIQPYSLYMYHGSTFVICEKPDNIFVAWTSSLGTAWKSQSWSGIYLPSYVTSS